MPWRVIDSGASSAAGNMAADEAIMLAHGAGEAPPTLRFYGWRPAAVSLGYFQRAAAEIDLDACHARGIDVVRRLTGGRAVLHDAELTYSVVVREDFPGVPPTITGAYRWFSGGLLDGLKRLGVEAGLSIPPAAYGQGRRSKHASAACFDAPAQYELTCAGRKLAGSAQVRKNGVILQHGSLLLRFDAAKVAAILRLPSPEARAATAAMLAGRAIGLEEALGRLPAWTELTDALTAGFAAALADEFVPGGLTAGERAVAATLAAEKYGCDSWNLLR
ncbi:biotin/lipoate A/B protein ligase family protein [Anaeroselena agilis]|uniref:Lipoate--protein ligase family protein n=1 Tax=Anaeroselena agilis TaxID=3063788 RepID=A0ABU3P256_9FIRM|nr:lipoate--protein ligase family protein [Selenomonadales bacterium 4137-cl]